jgi:hypothetical protein
MAGEAFELTDHLLAGGVGDVSLRVVGRHGAVKMTNVWPSRYRLAFRTAAAPWQPRGVRHPTFELEQPKSPRSAPMDENAPWITGVSLLAVHPGSRDL